MPVKAEAVVETVAKARVNIDLNQKDRPSGNCSNCGLSHPPKRCRAFGKECNHCHKKGHFSQYCRSKQCGCYPSQTKFNGSRQSHYDVHNIGIDQSQFDDAPQFEQDSVTN